jgi:hypothetical protein
MVDSNSLVILFNGVFVLLHEVIAKAQIIVIQRLLGLEPDGLLVILDCIGVHAHVLIIVPSVVIVQRVIGVQLDRSGEVTHSQAELFQVLIAGTPVVEQLRFVRC